MAEHDPCPSCGAGDTRVSDSRQTANGRWRRRHCRACGNRWATLEVTLDRDALSLVQTLRRTLRGCQAVVVDMERVLAGVPEDLPLVDASRRRAPIARKPE